MIFERLSNLIIKSKAKKLRRQVRVYNLQTAKTALILYDASSETIEKSARQLARFLKEEGIKVDSIAYYRKKNKEDQRPKDELSYHYYDQSGVNWLGFPQEQMFKKIIRNSHHLLIDLNFEEQFSLKFLASLSKAHFKIGRAKGYQKSVCDLTFEMKEEGIDFFIEQLKHYLKMINSK